MRVTGDEVRLATVGNVDRALCSAVTRRKDRFSNLAAIAAPGSSYGRVAQFGEVSKWRKRFHEQRLAGLDDLPRVGRPPAFPPRRRGGGQSTRV